MNHFHQCTAHCFLLATHFAVPQWVEGWVDFSRPGYILKWFTCLWMVTHPSTNHIWYRVTLLIETEVMWCCNVIVIIIIIALNECMTDCVAWHGVAWQYVAWSLTQRCCVLTMNHLNWKRRKHQTHCCYFLSVSLLHRASAAAASHQSSTDRLVHSLCYQIACTNLFTWSYVM